MLILELSVLKKIIQFIEKIANQMNYSVVSSTIIPIDFAYMVGQVFGYYVIPKLKKCTVIKKKMNHSIFH